MSQSTVRFKEAATLWGTESTFGTTPTMTRCFPSAEPSVEHTTAQVENDDESSLAFDYKDPVHGLQDATAKIEYHIRPYASQYSGSVALPSTHPLAVGLKTGLGGWQVGSGSHASGSTTTGSVVLGLNHGSRFAVGQLAGFTTTSGLEVRQIVSMSGDTAYVFPALASAPATASLVANMDNFYPTEDNSLSLTLQHAKAASSAQQWTLNGCLVDSIEFNLARGELVKATFNLKGASFVTGSQSISTTSATDPLAAPIVCRGTCLVQPITTVAATHYPLKVHSVKLNLGNVFLEETSGIEGKTGVGRNAQRMFGEATVRFRADTDYRAYWQNQTKMLLMIDSVVGTGSAKRHVTVYMPTAVIVGEPKTVNDGGFLYNEITLRAKLNQIIVSPSTELARAPFIIATG